MIDDGGDLNRRLAELVASQKDFVWNQEEDHFAWLQTAVVMLLPAVLLLALFLFLLPRFRDPLGGGFLTNYIKSPASATSQQAAAHHL